MADSLIEILCGRITGEPENLATADARDSTGACNEQEAHGAQTQETMREGAFAGGLHGTSWEAGSVAAGGRQAVRIVWKCSSLLRIGRSNGQAAAHGAAQLRQRDALWSADSTA